MLNFHSYVSGEFNNDIGLIRLAAPVKFTKNINPICLSQKGDPFVGRNAIVAGWGVTTVGSLVGSNVLREVHVIPYSNIADLRYEYAPLIEIHIYLHNFQRLKS